MFLASLLIDFFFHFELRFSYFFQSSIVIFVLSLFLVLFFSFSLLPLSFRIEFFCPFNHYIMETLQIVSSRKLYLGLSDCLAALFYLLLPSLVCLDSWIHSFSLVFWVSLLLLAIIYSLLRNI